MDKSKQNVEEISVETGSQLFILSCERSGSTLLRYIVDTHPRIACPGHLYLGRLCQYLYQTMKSSLGQALAEEKKEAVLLAECHSGQSHF